MTATVTGTRLGDLGLGLQLRSVRPLLQTLFRGDPYGELLAGVAEPTPRYERVRAAGSFLHSRVGPWVTARHDLGTRILRDRGLRIQRRDGLQPGGALLAKVDWNGSILGLDPPDHTRVRRLAQPAFTPRKIAEYRVGVERVCHRLLDAAQRRGGELDLVEDYAGPLPITVIGELLGVRDGDHEVFQHHGRAIGRMIDGLRSVSMARDFQIAQSAYRALFAELIAVRRAEPADDLVSVLAAAHDDGVVTEDELLALCVVLAVTGFETTTNLIGNATLALLEHPDQFALFRDDPDLGPRVVEETLRYDTPAKLASRVPHEEVEIGGHTVPADQELVVLLGAANRDPDVFVDPDRFDVMRADAAEHLSFSGGIHYCIGAPLARMEADVALRVLIERMPGLHRVGAAPRRRSPVISGLLRLPVAAG